LATSRINALSRAALIGLLGLSGAGVLLWLTLGGIEAFMAYTFNDTSVPLAQMNARFLVTMSPVAPFVATATLGAMGLTKFTPSRLLGAMLAFGLALALIVSVPWARSPIEFAIALIEQAR
jgi:hypothetical protein